MSEDWITFAMPKGRIFEEAAHLLRQAGYPLQEDFSAGRKLIVEAPEANMKFFLAKPMDVPTYVEHGVADIGVAGKDVLMEERRDVYEVLDLAISACHLAVAGLPHRRKGRIAPKIATKYPNIATQYFKEQGEQVEVIRLSGSIELAPLIGLAERIVDIVSTGKTLKENGLAELETIDHVTSRLIVNPVSYRMKDRQIDEIVQRLSVIVEEGRSRHEDHTG
ncbi:ATP phosphoribosyltransferase [Natribacillus halophilus]|uniref:ATP phosphoribosyltransferase n=1 Tax=Natribacillus halophilus TaxID=549003 RepID=A0A1G8KLQ0_9BACI|nr:ATP phosphoribosyltransferase [Natribacillus halophilus]SDI44367.1 ATP phosphoribosyltransferase catalytic subunit [Natribacillus halophilus]